MKKKKLSNVEKLSQRLRENEVERLMKKLEEEISKEGENTDKKIPWKVGRRKEATGRVSNIGNFTGGIYGRMFKKSAIDG